jgi:hypothetical protein
MEDISTYFEWFFKIFFALSFMVWSIIIARIFIFYAITIKTWKSVKGQIIDFDVKYSSAKGDPDHDGWKPYLKYRYIVEDVVYEGDTLTKNISVMLPSQDLVREHNKKFEEGKEILVTYNPKKPEKSVIEREFNYYSLLIFGVYIIVFFFFF